jgi:hypothetical protein
VWPHGERRRIGAPAQTHSPDHVRPRLPWSRLRPASRCADADAVIEKHLAALGGRAALAKLTSLQTITVKIAKVEHNVALDDAVFAKK